MENEKKTLQKLEIGEILKRVAAFSDSVSAKELIENFQPLTAYSDVIGLLSETDEALRLLNEYRISLSLSFDDVRAVCDNAKIGAMLSMGDVLKAMRILRTSRRMISAVQTLPQEEFTHITAYTTMLYTDKYLEEKIDFSILSETEMNDRASDKLFSVRQAIKKANADVRDKLASYLRKSEYAKLLQESIVTIRDNRYVIPVRAEYKNNISGLIHDQSASGATVFIEPLAVVDLNNRLRALYLEEKSEIERILMDFTDKIALCADALRQTQDVLTKLDFIFARAKYSDDTRSVRPKVNSVGFIDIRKGKHPLLKKDQVVPIDVCFGKKQRILMISGPNTGGKTVTLKTVGLFVLMIGCGLYLPCSVDSEISVFDRIFCDIGDGQSIEQNLSTFSSHILNIAEILKNISPKSLVLLDELGGGTEPKEGAALAVAVTDFILQTGCRAILTTHYGELKEYSTLHDDIENASMEFDPEHFVPTYRLIQGLPGSSNAIEIAKRLGLPECIVQKAKSILPESVVRYEQLLAEAEASRRKYEQLVSEQASLTQKLRDEEVSLQRAKENLDRDKEVFLKNSRNEAKRIVSEAEAEARELLNELKQTIQRASNDESDLFLARKKVKDFGMRYDAQEELTTDFGLKKVKATDLAVGKEVYVPKLGSSAVIIGIKKDRISVSAGNYRTELKPDDLFALPTSKKKESQKSTHRIQTDVKNKLPQSEINVLGKTVEEAIVDVDAFLDNAVVCGLNEVKIVHGFGTGALRKGLWEHFKKHPNVEQFRLGKYGEGEGGVTIVTLK